MKYFYYTVTQHCMCHNSERLNAYKYCMVHDNTVCQRFLSQKTISNGIWGSASASRVLQTSESHFARLKVIGPSNGLSSPQTESIARSIHFHELFDLESCKYAVWNSSSSDCLHKYRSILIYLRSWDLRNSRHALNSYVYSFLQQKSLKPSV